MKRDATYYAREDIAFNEWLEARREGLAQLALEPEAMRAMVRSAFLSGVRFGCEQAAIQLVGEVLTA